MPPMIREQEVEAHKIKMAQENGEALAYSETLQPSLDILADVLITGFRESYVHHGDISQCRSTARLDDPKMPYLLKDKIERCISEYIRIKIAEVTGDDPALYEVGVTYYGSRTDDYDRITDPANYYITLTSNPEEK